MPNWHHKTSRKEQGDVVEWVDKISRGNLDVAQGVVDGVRKESLRRWNGVTWRLKGYKSAKAASAQIILRAIFSSAFQRFPASALCLHQHPGFLYEFFVEHKGDTVFPQGCCYREADSAIQSLHLLPFARKYTF